MRFDKISITNTRLIGENALELSFRKDKNIFVLLGDNGYGKTTILDAMATALAVYAMQFPGIQDYQISDLDVHINRHGHRASYSAITAELTYEGNPISVTRYRKGVANTPKTNYDGTFGEELPLIYGAGNNPNEAWLERGICIPTSMRNVDSSCEAQVLLNRYVSEED